jgi:hypothetical protein
MGTSPPSTPQRRRSQLLQSRIEVFSIDCAQRGFRWSITDIQLMQSDIPLVMDTWEEAHSYEVHGNSSMKL